MDTKNLSLPKLNQLNPTLESTTLKLMEEAGELAQVLGKFRGLSGEQVSMDEDTIISELANELLDVAQTAVTMMFVLEEKFGINIEDAVQRHCSKLEHKGYLAR
jgi:NTP pyrophosphatase (non-canonical NTP hydrolase)